MNTFPAFGSYVCAGDSVECERDGIRFVARIEHDSDTKIDDCDTHNPDINVTGCTPEQQNKLLAARAAWMRDEWFYCGIVISAYAGTILVDEHAASLWGIEANYPGSDNKYLQEVANELLVEALAAAHESVQRIRDALAKVGAMRPDSMRQAYDWANDEPPRGPDGEPTYWYIGSGIELAITLDDARSCSHSGPCDEDVAALSVVPYIAEQLTGINEETLRAVLEEYGAWDDEQLADHAQNLQRLLWGACNDIVEEYGT